MHKLQQIAILIKKNFLIIMLTGSDLLAKVKELGDVSKSDLVRACGYVSTKKMEVNV